MSGAGLAAALQSSLARLDRGLTVVPGKGLVGVFVFWSHVDPQAIGLYKDLHATMHASLSLGLDAVDGVKALSLKGDGLAGAS